MRRQVVAAVVLGALGLLLGPATRALAACPADSVESGTVCIDKYEASVWYVPPSQTALITRIQRGTVKLADLTSARAQKAGVVQRGATGNDYGLGCPESGNKCVDLYAVSIPGVTPSAYITWFQAAAVARNSNKRLPTNQEWQVAALGTPDPGTCNVISGAVASTGAAPGCVSDVGAFDMVGNVYEWVADWVPAQYTSCLTGDLFGSGDDNCLNQPSTGGGPGALARGGDGYFSDTHAGVFAISVSAPTSSSFNTGFRALR